MTEQLSPIRTLWDPSQVYVGKPVSREDSIRAADDWCIFIEAFRSGSTIVDPVSAKDVDIFVRERACLQMQSTKSYRLDAGYSHWYVFLSDYRLTQYDPTADDPLYAAAKEAREITALYRSEQYGWNVIVVADDFWPAYISAHRQLTANPEVFTQKHMRQNLFIKRKNVIHSLLGNEPRPLMEEILED
ncbi:hypothetical protein HOS22_gp27 [Rhizobium phage RHEph08]|uniref:Uncharacterized protein n=2 Tax=Cuernavacavirus TaxID=2731935 RepID=L7TS11_9CAUD|nr:hypothetical protein HOS22_gp27 [Rhizobium phage RHEph08]YP_009793265.1 hypothetical protein HOS23_gp23 [Rhizobium phage RHEph09]AGC35951.1 hypothetical protein RHEph08_gp027 [Rhizobium phage RHEph08]AGC36006.1 hypothetical protein RHEph09_gp023 [Rhizobium phage RHEph09]